MKNVTVGAIILALLPTIPFAQTASYDAQLLQIVESELDTWINDPFLLYAVEEQNERHAALTPDEIARLDTAWIKEEGSGPMIYDLLDRQASILLRERRERSGGAITEIIVMDRFGLNAAISDPTSDYFQGDEAKYQETYLIGPGAVHIGDLEFDESTQKMQVQVSLPVLDPITALAIGAVTFGIDLDVVE